MPLFPPAWALVSAALLVCSCGTFPLPKVYLLGDPVAEAPGITNEAGLPDIELMTVSVPDYLDSTDIIRRTTPNQVITSETGRWGERVSLGITDALAADLARQLPGVVIEYRGAQGAPYRLEVEVQRFEIGADGSCTVTARWRLTSKGVKTLSASEQGSFTEAASPGSDAAAAQAMTSLIDQLSRQIALTIRASLPLHTR